MEQIMLLVWGGLALNTVLTYYIYLASSAPYDKVPHGVAWVMIAFLLVAITGALLINSSRRLLGTRLLIVGALGCFPVGLVAIFGALKVRKLHYRRRYHAS